MAESGPGFSATAPDLLGFGRSPKPRSSSYTVEEHLDALAPLLEPASLVVGHSTGALLGAALAAREPGAVSALLLLGLPAYPDLATARVRISRLGLLARLTVEGNPTARLVCQTMCLFRPVAVTVGPLLIRDLPAAVVADAARYTWESYSRTLQAGGAVPSSAARP